MEMGLGLADDQDDEDEYVKTTARAIGVSEVLPDEDIKEDPSPGIKYYHIQLKETKSATMNIFLFFFLFKSFVKVQLNYVFTVNLFTIAENCMEK